MKKIPFYGFLLGMLILLSSVQSFSADLIEVLPITHQIIRLTFDEGYVENRGSKTDAITHRWPLDINMAERNLYYQIKSEDDANYTTGQMPIKIGRKSKIHDISTLCKWNETLEKCLNDYVQSHFIYLELPFPMENGKSYSVAVPALSENISQWDFTFDVKTIRSPAIHINQMGYAPESKKKFAYVSQWMGDMGSLELDKHPNKQFDIYKLSAKGKPLESIFTGKMKKQKDLEKGGPDSNKDDVGPLKNFMKTDVWQCNFSKLNQEGEYVLVIQGIGCSYPFRISLDSYFEPFYYAARACYLGRAIDELPEKYAGMYARPLWKPSIVYTRFRTMDLKSESGQSQKQEIYDQIDYNFDVSHIHGWYHDAGDWDGYISHFRVPRTLMTTYELAPENFQDGELNIPETQMLNGYSGTHIPDILDEAVWLVDYFKSNIGPTGGIYGSRVQPDISTKDGLSNADYHESMGFSFKECVDQSGHFWSWNDCRTWIVHGEDPRDSYMFANIAAQYAYNLKIAAERTGENYDAIIQEYFEAATDAYQWAELNVTDSEKAFSGASHNQGSIQSAKTVAAVWLYKLTGEDVYHQVIDEQLTQYDKKNWNFAPDKWAVWGYVTINDLDMIYTGTFDRKLKKQLIKAVRKYAEDQVSDAIEEHNRSMRQGGSFTTPILNGQATTPLIIPAIVAYEVTGIQKYLDACYTTCDYMLGGNQLNYVWLTNVGHEYPKHILHKDTEGDGIDGNIPGVPPYSPRTRGDWFKYKGDRFDYQGPWDNDFYLLDGRIYPDYQNEAGQSMWPVHELFFDQYPAPAGTEFTIHQNIAPAAAAYGYLTARNHGVSEANVAPSAGIKVNASQLKKGEIIEIEVDSYDPDGWIYSVQVYQNHRLIRSLDPKNAILKWIPPTCGKYILEAVITDNLGAKDEVKVGVEVVESPGQRL